MHRALVLRRTALTALAALALGMSAVTASPSAAQSLPDAGNTDTPNPETAGRETSGPEPAGPETAAVEATAIETTAEPTASQETAAPESANPDSAPPEPATASDVGAETATVPDLAPELIAHDRSDAKPAEGIGPAEASATGDGVLPEGGPIEAAKAETPQADQAPAGGSEVTNAEKTQGDAAEAEALATSLEDFIYKAAPASPAVNEVLHWVVATGDNVELPYVIVDKVAAEIFVFDGKGEFLGATPALLGSAIGDDSVEGVGDRELSDIKPEDRTTPAGRFLASFGPATNDREVLWVDFTDAISMHPVVYANRKEKRLERLVSATPDDNRITYGCINISQHFYDKIVAPLFKDTKGVVYVLPEVKSLAEVFQMTPATETAAVRAGEPALNR